MLRSFLSHRARMSLYGINQKASFPFITILYTVKLSDADCDRLARKCGKHGLTIGALAVSADYSFIVPTGTMIVHPVRSTGMFIGVMQSYRNMEKTQDRITKFIASHSNITQDRLLELMLDSSQLVKDVGTMLEGEQAVKEGMIDEVGGIKEAFAKLHSLIDKEKEKQEKNLMT